MDLVVCEHLDILLIFNWLDPGQCLGHTKGLKVLCRFIAICLRYLIWLWNHHVQKWLNVQHEITWREIWKFSIQDLFYYIVLIFCIGLHKADFIMSIVAQVSDVAHESLFNDLTKIIEPLFFGNSSTKKFMIFNF